MMVTGDGGMDIGMGPAIGAANRNHRMIILEYDNQGYMNTGAQLSYATPLGHRTSTSEVGAARAGKVFHHKDTAQIFAACHLPYVFTASEGYPEDFMRKVAKAQWYRRFCRRPWTRASSPSTRSRKGTPSSPTIPTRSAGAAPSPIGSG
jgi:pyruvate ferredoxin oxidoreductase alpha subunit